MHHLSRRVQTLLSLLKVSEHGSINKAAEVLHISQPALTRSILRLEEILDAPLLERSAKGVVPTPYGKALLARARVIEAELVNAARDIEALKNNRFGALRIGATPLVAGHFLPRALEAIYAKFPTTPVRLVESNRPELLGLLRRNELDCVVSMLPFDAKEPDLTQQSLFELDLRVIVRQGHALAKRPNLTLHDLSTSPWILPRPGSALYKRVEREFRRGGAEFPESVIETSSLETTRSLVRSTDLVAILPLHAVAPQLAEGSLVALSGDWSFERRTVGLFFREGQPYSPACKTLAKVLKAAYGKNRPAA